MSDDLQSPESDLDDVEAHGPFKSGPPKTTALPIDTDGDDVEAHGPFASQPPKTF